MSESQPPSPRDPQEPFHAEVFNPQSNSNFRATSTSDSGAILALVLAISSWIILPLVGAIAALVIAPGAKHRIRQANGDLGSTAIVTAAQVIAFLNVALIVVVVGIAWLLLKAIF